jgi:hypothetical protein
MNFEFGYVKFSNDISDPIYELVNIATVCEWLDEFETSINTFSDIGFEKYDGILKIYVNICIHIFCHYFPLFFINFEIT